MTTMKHLAQVAKRKTKSRQSRTVWLTLAGLAGVAIVLAFLMNGRDLALMNPNGQIASDQSKLMIGQAKVMLILAIPTLILLYWIAWRFRDSALVNTNEPKNPPSSALFVMFWLIPASFILVLAHTMWPATHKLDPHQAIASDSQTLTVQVIALRWKWLFIYPQQNVASLNFVELPANTPIKFELTADEAPMNSFWIPHLSGQLYAMTGHNNQLNIKTGEPGDYAGSAAEINGEGFAGMKFTAHVGSRSDFNAWLETVQKTAGILDTQTYQKLIQPSQNNPVTFYAAPVSNLYDIVLAKYTHNHQESL